MKNHLFIIAFIFSTFLSFGQKIVKDLDTVRVEIEPMGSSINTEFDEYAPVISRDGLTLYFTSKKPLNEKDKNSFEKIYITYFDVETKSWSLPVILPENVNDPNKNNSMVFMFENEKKFWMYQDDSKGNGNILALEKTGSTWTSPKSISSVVNTASQETSATLSADGKIMYFVSDREGGSGKKDIWQSTFQANGTWSSPKNLGNIVNSMEDEESVFMHSDGKTLFFSSKGHNTLGGYDVFKTVYENDEWSKPINLGSPINTSDDELFFNLNQEGIYGVYCSNRGATSKNIFTINLIAKNQLNVKSTKFKLKGIVVDPSTKEPVEAKIMVFDASTNELIATVKSDIETGKYSVVLPTEKKYILSVSTPKYMFNSSLLSAEETDNVIEIKKDFDLNKIIKGATITSNFIDFDAEANVLPSSKTELLRIFQLLAENPKLTIEIVSHTDVEGDFGQNQIISNKRAKAILDYLVLEGIPKDRMKSSGLGESKPIYSEAEILKQPKEKQKELRFLNQRTDINVLIY